MVIFTLYLHIENDQNPQQKYQDKSNSSILLQAAVLFLNIHYSVYICNLKLFLFTEHIPW